MSAKVFMAELNYRTLNVNNFVSVDFQTQDFALSLLSMKFYNKIINKKGITKVQQCRQNLFIRITERNFQAIYNHIQFHNTI